METEKCIFKRYEPFQKLPLKTDLISGLKANQRLFLHHYPLKIECGYIKPYDIQEKALIPMIKDHDVFVQSSCASGKTILCLISALQLIDPAVKKCQALILYHSRYKVHPAKEMAMKIGRKMDLKAVALVGGVSSEDQKKILKEGVSLVLGTPGRVFDLLELDILVLKDLRLIIVEDCDEILEIGFEEIMKKLLKFVPTDVQMCIFSSDCSIPARKFNEFCLRNPVYINKYYPPKELKDFEHLKFQVEKEEDKVEFLSKLFNELGKQNSDEIDMNTKSIIYCKEIEDTERLVQIFEGNNLNIISIVKGKFYQEVKFLGS